MSKIVKRILEDVAWLADYSAVLTIFFVIVFIVIIYQVVKMRKKDVEEYKNMPLEDDDPGKDEKNKSQ